MTSFHKIRAVVSLQCLIVVATSVVGWPAVALGEPPPEVPDAVTGSGTPVVEIAPALPAAQATPEPLAVEPVMEAAVVTAAPSLVTLHLDGGYRLNGQWLSDFTIDRAATPYGQNGWLEHRLSVAPKVVAAGTFTIAADVQVASGFLAVDPPSALVAPWGLPRGRAGAAFGDHQRYVDQLALRKLYAEYHSPIGVFRVGRMSSHWGLGLLANDGDHERVDWGAPRFGRDRNFGDVVNRVFFATTPAAAFSAAPWARKLALAVGGDLLERDERFSRQEGDLAFQGLVALRYGDDDEYVGAYVAYRDLRDRHDEWLRVWAYDVAARGDLTLGNLVLYGALEVVAVSGRTTLGRTAAYLDPQRVAQLGYVLRGGAGYRPWRISLDVEAGYASGDSNPFDGHIRDFAFDPDYNPSLVLFEELRAAETAAAAARASDPALLGRGPTALTLMPSLGAVTNAIYVRPTVRYRFDGALEGLGARAAMVYAVPEEPVVDPYQSTLFGGSARGPRGRPARRASYGTEIDVGVDYARDVFAELALRLSAQGGVLLPGPAFANLANRGLDPIFTVLGLVAVQWNVRH